MNLTPEIKLELERRGRQTKDKHEHTRLCIILARSEGVSLELIAQTHRISVSSVFQYLADYGIQKKEGVIPVTTPRKQRAIIHSRRFL